MLPLLALRRQPPTGVPLSDNKVEIKITWLPSNRVIWVTTTTGNVDTWELDWALAWVGRHFGKGNNYTDQSARWTMTRPAFNAAVAKMNATANRPATYRNTTPWTLEKIEQKQLDTNGEQYVKVVFAMG